MFKGSIVALITPMTPSGDIDYASLQKLVQFQVENGTHAIVAVGTTGESATLPVTEHIQVIEKIVQYAEGNIGVIAGTGANSTAEAIELGGLAEGVGAQALLSVVPYYNRPQQRGMVAHFNAIADAANTPVLLYNVPSRTVADLSNESLTQLSEHPNIIGIKDATGDMQRLAQAQACTPNDFLILSGDDSSSCEFLCRGGHGVISVTANIAPAEIDAMCTAAAEQQFTRAREINQQIAELHDALFIEPNPVMPKWALYKMGLTPSPTLRLPMVEPKETSQAAIEKLLRDLGKIA